MRTHAPDMVLTRNFQVRLLRSDAEVDAAGRTRQCCFVPILPLEQACPWGQLPYRNKLEFTTILLPIS